MEMEPFVLRGFLAQRQWPPMLLWSRDYMAERFSRGKRPAVRFGRRQRPKGEILHDHKSARHEFADFGQMLDWMMMMTKANDHGQEASVTIPSACSSFPSPSTSTIFPNGHTNNTNISPQTHWVYLDYKDIEELLDPDDAAKVDWVRLGVVKAANNEKGEEEEEKPWTDSTIWIGTPGAYTPCHYDTYGFNLHAQIRGHKRWLLFPPGAQLWPTRLPYEESSVFSSLDVLNGDQQEPRLRGIRPRAVTLGPGDLLFVPPRWWHSVQCVDAAKSNNEITADKQSCLCVSVNKWFPVGQDRRESAKEALLKYMMAMHANCGLLNPAEHICLSERHSMDDMEELAEFVQFRLQHFQSQQEEEGKSHKKKKIRKLGRVAEDEAEELEETEEVDDETKEELEEDEELKEEDDEGKEEDDETKEDEAKEEERLDEGNSQLRFFYANFRTHPLAEAIPEVSWKGLKKNMSEEMREENDDNEEEEESEEFGHWKVKNGGKIDEEALGINGRKRKKARQEDDDDESRDEKRMKKMKLEKEEKNASNGKRKESEEEDEEEIEEDEDEKEEVEEPKIKRKKMNSEENGKTEEEEGRMKKKEKYSEEKRKKMNSEEKRKKMDSEENGKPKEDEERMMMKKMNSEGKRKMMNSEEKTKEDERMMKKNKKKNVPQPRTDEEKDEEEEEGEKKEEEEDEKREEEEEKDEEEEEESSPAKQLKMELLEAMSSSEVLDTLLDVIMKRRRMRDEHRIFHE